MEASERKKRVLDKDENQKRYCASPENKSISPRLLDAQVGLSTSSGCHGDTAGAQSDRKRITGAVKCRRLGSDLSAAPSSFVAKLTHLPGSVAPALHLVGDPDGKTSFVSGPLELQATHGQRWPIFATGDTKNIGKPNISTSSKIGGCALEPKNSSPAHARGQESSISAKRGMPGISPIGSQEQKSLVAGDRGLTGQINNNSPVFGALVKPSRVPIAASSTTPLSKQVIARDPFPAAQQQILELQHVEPQNVEPVKGIRTPRQHLDEMKNTLSNAALSAFDADDVSSDEELIGIPGPEILDPEVSFSQDRLRDLSVAENCIDNTIVLRLCDGLTNSLTQVERDRMELLNLFTIALAHLASPIVLGRDQFQEVFGDNIRGGMISHLSRRHCLVYVENQLRDDCSRAGTKVRVEDTSTNGIRVNGVQLRKGQVCELELNDTITLLRIHQNEDDVSLEYKLVQFDLPLKNSKRRRVSRHDGRFVRPGDKFSSESLDVSNCLGICAAQEPKIMHPSTAPAQAIAQEMRHQIPMRPVTPAGAHSPPKTEENMKKVRPLYQNGLLARRIQCTILLADQSTQDFSESSQPFEEANFDYREELSEILSAFASIRTFDASSYHCATGESIHDALRDDSDVIIYTGGGDMDHLVVEAPNGLSARFEKNDILKHFTEEHCIVQKLIIVLAPTPEPAKLLVECGALHVCFVSSTSKHSLRVTAFIRALFAGLLKGFAIEKSYALANFVAFNDLLPIVRRADQICSLLPTSDRHNIEIGSLLAEVGPNDRNVMALLNAPFIPVLAPHFLGRDAQVKQIKAVLAQKARVCSLYGSRGIGKSSIAIHIAKVSYRTRGYRNGVHYIAVGKLVEEILNSCKSIVAEFDGGDQRNDPLREVTEGVESLLRSLPETDPANYPTTLLVLDGCDIVLSALKVFVMNILRSFPSVQILLTSTKRLQLDSAEAKILPIEAICVHELGKVDSARLFLQLARGQLTSRQFRQHFPNSSIEAISNDMRVLGTRGNPFRISRLVYDLESQTANCGR